MKPMNNLQIRELVKKLDTTSALDQEADWTLLRPLGIDVVPFLADAFDSTKKRKAALLSSFMRFVLHAFHKLHSNWVFGLLKTKRP